MLSVILNAPGYLAIALIVFPKIYRYSRNLLAKAYALPHITAARARGLGEVRILAWHVLPVAGPQMIALAGITVSIALGASIPVEALCGLPGIGQLAWQAALSRDLPLLVNLTVLVTLVTLLANSGADVMNYMLRPPEPERCMNAARKLACVVVLVVCAVSLGRELAGACRIRQAISRSSQCASFASASAWHR